jgi:DNA-directed RNA polymerase subunit RPC12/RpoP
MPNQPDPWRRFRVLRRVGIVSVIFFFSSFAFVGLGRLDGRLVAYGWMLFVLVMLTVTHEARCPRCGQRFYAKGFEFWQMTSKCLHCGQRKYAELPKTKSEAS